MSEKLQFSKNYLAKKENKILKLFYGSGQYIASFKTDYNETKSSISNVLFDIDKKIDLIGFFNEIITQMILYALTLPIKELIFENFPLTHNDFNDIFKKFKKEYEDSINIVDMELDSMQCIKRVVIKIQLPKNTHYIQQAYLRNFSSNNEVWKLNNQKEKARIFVFNKSKKQIETIGNTPVELSFGQKIKSIAKEDYFYSLAMEQLMGSVYETLTPPIFKKMIENPKIIILTGEEKEIIADYILLTWQRTKEHRKNLEEMYSKTVKIFAEDTKGKKLPNVRVEVNPEYLKRLHEEMIINSLAPKSDDHKIKSHRLLNLQWKIMKTKSPYTFLTSDNPVVFFNSYYEKEKKKGNDFLNRQIENIKKYRDFDNWDNYIELKSSNLGRAPMNKGVEIYLPISPTICLCLYDSETTKTLLTPQKINREIIFQADEYIFSHHNRLNFIKKIISKNPSCVDRDGNRQEIRASFKNLIKSKQNK